MKRKSIMFHLDIQTHRKNPYGLLRNSYREDGKVKKETICRFSGLSIEQPLLDTDGVAANRKYTFGYLMENLKSIRKETVEVRNLKSFITTTPTDEQQYIFQLLDLNL